MEYMAGGTLFDWNTKYMHTVDEQMYQHFMYQTVKALEVCSYSFHLYAM